MDYDDKRALLKVMDVSNLLQIGRSSVYELIRSGQLPTVKIGRATRIPAVGIDEWLVNVTRVSDDGTNNSR